jgi:hypothetical protein
MTILVIPAIPLLSLLRHEGSGIPAFAGMTEEACA